MCMLTYFPPGVQPNVEALYNGAFVNNDGHGYAMIVDGAIMVGKGMDREDMIDSFAILRQRHPDGPALFHSRMGTHGVRSEFNVHPFYVGGDTRTVMAHNGIFPKSACPSKKDPRSDTRLVAEWFLPKAPFGKLSVRRNRLQFASWMGPWNKVVILTVDPRFRGNAFILNEKQGVWDGGAWYSNRDFEPFVYVSRRALADWETAVLGTCPDCLGVIDYANDDACPACGWCLWCGDAGDICQCEHSRNNRNAPEVIWPPLTRAETAKAVTKFFAE